MSRWDDFEREVEHLVNRLGLDNTSGTPDFVLSKYLRGCLEAWEEAASYRAVGRGSGAKPFPSMVCQQCEALTCGCGCEPEKDRP